MNDKRIPPQNLDAERSVIGAILIDVEALAQVGDSLLPNHFYAPQHQIIYEAILTLYQAAKPIDVITLTNELKKHKKIGQIGGSAYLSELIAQVPTSAHIKEYAEIVVELATRRRLISLSGKLDELSRNEERKLEDLLNELEGDVFSLSQNNTQKDFLSAKELAELHFQKTEEYSRNPNALRGIPTGLKVVDNILGGLHKSDLLILAARPAVGKSSFAYTVARHISVNESKSVAIFSLEMPAVQIYERVLAQQINVKLWDLRMGSLSDEGYMRYADGVDKFTKSKFFVDDTAGLNIMQLRSRARKLKMEKGLDFMVVDYLQLMQGTSMRVDNRALEVAEISRSLKLLARELDIPIMALSQLNRAVESRSDRIPQLSDLRESGSIEQDADVVIFLNREKLYNPETEKGDLTDVIVAKHRNGAVGRVEIRFSDHNANFLDMD